MTRVQHSQAVGAWMLAQRLALGLSQRAVAEGVNASEASISRWELGQANMATYMHECLKTFFRRKLEELPAKAAAQAISAAAAYREVVS